MSTESRTTRPDGDRTTGARHRAITRRAERQFKQATR